MKKQILKNLKRNKGITLIALVITIIVLIILAGVSISTLIGENGLITQANQAKNDTQKANVIELVQTEILAAEAKTRSGDIDGPTMLSILSKYFNTDGITADDLYSDFKLKTKSEYGNHEIAFGEIYNSNLTKSNYSVPVNEDDIHPEIFITESNNDGQSEGISTVTIIGIEPEYVKEYYCSDWHGDVVENAPDKELLIIPDKIGDDTVTRVEWGRLANVNKELYPDGYGCLSPNLVKRVIMPNTLISYTNDQQINWCYHDRLDSIVLSKNLESINISHFDSKYMTNITIPAGIKQISCLSQLEHIKTIKFQGTQEQWEKASSSTGNTWNGATVVTSK